MYYNIEYKFISMQLNFVFHIPILTFYKWNSSKMYSKLNFFSNVKNVPAVAIISVRQINKSHVLIKFYNIKNMDPYTAILPQKYVSIRY